MIYLDNNATTMPDPAVREAMLPFLGERYGNPSSTHRFGQDSRHAVEEARFQVAGLLGCDPKELFFTSGGTESDNAAIMGLLAVRAGGGPKRLIVTSTVEHSAVREPLGGLKKMGYEIEYVGMRADGTLDIEALGAILRQRAAEVALVTIMWVNNETGLILDIPAVGALCRQHGVPLHVDGVQAVGKMAFALRDVPVDLMSVSGHKFHGPKGVGTLYVRRGVRWQPWMRGGPQERDRRGGTENVPGIVGMGRAAELAATALTDGQTLERIRRLRDRLEREIVERIAGAHVIGVGTGGAGTTEKGESGRVGNTTNIAFAGLEAEAILLLLSEQEICASAGAACSSGSLEPSPVLRAMGVDDRIGHGAIRWSLSRFTTNEEIDTVLAILPEVIARLRATLPV